MNLDRLGIALATAFGFADGSCAALRNHFTYTVGAGFSLAFRNHFAGGVVAHLAAVLANHFTDLVANFLGAAFGNHFAGGVVAHLLAVLANHAADLVSDLFGAALRDHSANGVVAGLRAAFRNHFADTISASLGTALRYNSTNGVGHLTSTAFASVSSAADLFLLTGGNPNFFTHGFGRTLDAFSPALAGHVNTFACAWVKVPCSGFADGLPHDRTRNRLGFRFPMTAFDGHRAFVLFRNAHTVLFRSHFLFANRVVYGVIYFPCFCFVNGLADGVFDRPGFRLIDWLADCVLDGLCTRFVNRLLDGVVDRTLMRFVHGFADRVFDCFLPSLVHWSADGVIDRLLVLFVHGFADGVIDRPGACFVFRHHHGVIDVTRGRFWDKSAALNLAVFVIDLLASSVASLFHLVINRLAYRTHASVSTTSHRGGGYFIALSGFSASTTALIADRTTIRSARGVVTGHDRADHDGGYDPQPIHLDFSTGNNTSVARRSFSENGASALISRHRSPCLFLGRYSQTAFLCDVVS